MALIVCDECKREISSSAYKCPQCGHQRTTPAAKGCATFIVAIVVLPILIGMCDGLNRRGRPGGTESQVEDTSASVAIRATDLSEEYKANEISADNRFKGKMAEISGVIGHIKKDVAGTLYLTVGSGALFEIPTVQALFDDSHNAELSQLQPGQRVIVKCRIKGLMMNVLADRCTIVRVQ